MLNTATIPTNQTFFLKVKFLQTFTSSSHNDQLVTMVILTRNYDYERVQTFDFNQPMDDYMQRLMEHQRLGYRWEFVPDFSCGNICSILMGLGRSGLLMIDDWHKCKLFEIIDDEKFILDWMIGQCK